VKGGFAIPVLGQIFLLLFNSGVLDFGVTFRLTLAAVIAHWITLAIIVLRRRNSVTPGDACLIRFAFIIYYPIMFLVFHKWTTALTR
jgi:uncharacterized membrane protein